MLNMKKNQSPIIPAIVMSVFFVLIIAVTGLTVNVALAQSDLIIYPKEDQSEGQMEKDKYECYIWAKKQTGFDPMEVPKTTEPPPPKEAKKGGVLKGAAGGALLGTVIGGIADDEWGKGAAIGAAAGGLFGGMRKQQQQKQQKQAEQQWAQEQAAQYGHNRNNYNRAYAACLEARGYTVK
jgi:hypothetical protein